MLNKYTQANLEYYEMGVKMLELAKNAHFIYKNATVEEKKEFLSFLLSDSTIKDQKPFIQLKEPFDIILKKSMYSDRF